MERYRYRAAGPGGQVTEGVLEAPSRGKALEELRARTLVPVSLETAPAASRGRRRMRRAGAVSAWTRYMATLLSAGMPLDRALAATVEHADHPALEAALRAVRSAVRGGGSLGDALSAHPAVFPAVLVAMVRAGEATGALDTVLEQAADHLEEADELRSQVLSALLYPALMAAVASLGVIVLLVFVIPRFSAMLVEVGGTLPWSTRALVAGSGLLTGWWWLWLAAAAGLVMAARAALARDDTRVRWHAARLAIPVAGDLERKYAAARFTRTTGMLLRSGVPLLGALRIARGGVTNAALARELARAEERVAEGDALAPSLGPALPRLAVQMLAVGEESGRLEELCLRVARTYDAQVRRALRTLVAAIEPAMILLFGALVGFVAIAMLQAIYSINTGIL